jgi:hypothetical protein
LQEALNPHERATGAKVNIRKSRAVALGCWDTTHRILDIPYQNEAKILGFHIANTVKESAHKSWTITTARIRAQAQEAYHRDLSLDRRIQYVHHHLLARVWYLAQICTPPETCVRQLNTTFSWFVWRGYIFSVPLSALQKKKGPGGWGLKHLSTKSHALFFCRLKHHGSQTGTMTAEWLHRWGLLKGNENPPHRSRIPANMEYLRRFAIDSAYIADKGTMGSMTAYKRRIYDMLHHISSMETEPREMIVATMWPQINWPTVWKNLDEAPVAGETKAACYMLINDVITTNEKLHKIRMATTDRCRYCDNKDTLQHRITECGNGKSIWKWTRQKLALMLRTVPEQSPSEWIIRPHFTMWPPARRRAVLWVLANVVYFRTQMQRELTLQDLLDFLKRAKWKMCQRRNYRQKVGDYLNTIERDHHAGQ